jgi:serine/threonine protein kinase
VQDRLNLLRKICHSESVKVYTECSECPGSPGVHFGRPRRRADRDEVMNDQEMDEQERDEAFHFAGDRLGKFVILGELGRGSMGVVYEAFQEDLKRKVALKVLPANIALDVKQVRRFRREAESVARMNHANVIQIFEVGQLENTHYFAMELVDGAPFGSQSFLRDRAFIDDAARIVRDAARGVAHAHEMGVIHRDMKPSNLLVDRSGRVVVTDFGLARLSESASLTSTDAIVGTPKYMAPEQILPGTYPMDGRCDVYGLGATLYEGICGHPPIDAPSVQAFLRAILEERPTWPRKKNRLVPHDLSTIVMRCLEKHPDERYASAEALAEDLDRYLNGERIQAKPKGLAKRGLAFVNRHKVVSALTTFALIAIVVTISLTQQLGSTKKTSELRGEVALLLEQNNLAGLELLAQGYSANEFVDSALATLRVRRAMTLLESSREKIDRHFLRILELLELAGKQRSFWYLMVLFECERSEEARTILDTGELRESLALIVRARLALMGADYDRARLLLEPEPLLKAPLEYRAIYFLVRARALRALKELDEARATLGIARSEKKLLSQTWLAYRVDRAWSEIKELAVGVDRLDFLNAVFGDMGDATAALLANLSRISEDMTAEERQSASTFVERVLAIANVKTTGSSELVAAGRDRVESGVDDTERVIGYLLQAIGLLANGETVQAREALALADDLGVDELLPYVHWALSLCARADREIGEALSETQRAIELVQFAKKFPLEDATRLIGHAVSLRLRSGEKRWGQFRLQVRQSLPDWYRRLWDKITSSSPVPEKPGTEGDPESAGTSESSEDPSD